ncbi:MAG: RnfABCDGE type electron transport complex subunit B, partial [Lautropia sp.]
MLPAASAGRADPRPIAGPAAAGLAQRIDALLPQTQCRRCGFDGCRPYADAIAAGSAPINRCPPGGDGTIAALAALLERPRLPLDPACGAPQPHRVARIEIAGCIGCTKCLRACPVDAIVGAPKHQHHVLADRCTGCDLCLPPCPTDCIVMEPRPLSWDQAAAARGRRHHAARRERLDRAGPDAAAAASAPPALPPSPALSSSPALPVSSATPTRDPLVALALPAERARRLAAIRARARA